MYKQISANHLVYQQFNKIQRRYNIRSHTKIRQQSSRQYNQKIKQQDMRQSYNIHIYIQSIDIDIDIVIENIRVSFSQSIQAHQGKLRISYSTQSSANRFLVLQLHYHIDNSNSELTILSPTSWRIFSCILPSLTGELYKLTIYHSLY